MVADARVRCAEAALARMRDPICAWMNDLEDSARQRQRAACADAAVQLMVLQSPRRCDPPTRRPTTARKRQALAPSVVATLEKLWPSPPWHETPGRCARRAPVPVDPIGRACKPWRYLDKRAAVQEQEEYKREHRMEMARKRKAEVALEDSTPLY